MPDLDVSPDPSLEAKDRPLARWGDLADPRLATAGPAPLDGSAGASAGDPAVAESLRGGRLPAGTVAPHPPSTGLALLQVAACCGYPTQILAMLLLAGFGFGTAASPDEWSLTYVATILLLDSLIVVGLAVVFLRLHGERPIDVFLGMQPLLGEVVRGLLLVPMVFVMVGTLAFLVQHYAPWLHKDVNPFQTLINAPHGMLVVGALSILVGGLREEIQRAFILHRFAQIGAAVPGLIAFSLLFGLGHQIQGWDAVIMTSALGAVWGAVYLRRRSLVAPAVCHAAFDVIQVAALGMRS